MGRVYLWLSVAIQVSTLLRGGVAVAAPTPNALVPDPDLAAVAQRLIQTMVTAEAGDCSTIVNCPSSDPAAPVAARRDAAALRPDGSWPDVNYTDRTRTGSWSPHLHLDRVVNLAAVIALSSDARDRDAGGTARPDLAATLSGANPSTDVVTRTRDDTSENRSPTASRSSEGSSSGGSSGTAPPPTLDATLSPSPSPLLEPTLRAIRFYLKVDPQSDNWWWNQLRAPARVADAALLLGPRLDAPTLAGMLGVMGRAVYSGRTGANLDDEVATAIKRAAIVGNRTLMATAFARLWSEVRIVQPSGCLDPPRGTTGCPTDGIQADRSFHQHGPELLAGTYGEAYAGDTLRFAWLAAGTSFALPPLQAELFASLLLDGMQWMTVARPAVWDWSVRGRDLGTRPRTVHLNTSFFAALQSSRSYELEQFGLAIDGNPGEELRGHRGYWTSDYSVVHSVGRDGRAWMASVHMHSNRTVSARCVNGQGALNEHTGDGMVYTYFSETGGTEYAGTVDSWDWRRLPGITADVEAPMLPCAYAEQLLHDSARMTATGTVSDGVAGLSAMLLTTRNASARKAVAMLPHALVHLAAGVHCTPGALCGALVTTIENRVAHGSVMLACGGQTAAVPPGTLRAAHMDCTWAWHNGTGYLFRGPVLVTNGAESNTSAALFSLAVPHARGNDAAAVVALPGSPLESMPALAAAAGNVTVLTNTPTGQAVWDGLRQQLLAVVWAPAVPLTINQVSPTGYTVVAVQADRPCALLLEQSSDCGSFNVTVADLGNDPAGGTLTVQLTGTLGASVCPVAPCACATVGNVTSVRFSLPQGYSAGQSVTTTCIPGT